MQDSSTINRIINHSSSNLNITDVGTQLTINLSVLRVFYDVGESFPFNYADIMLVTD